MKFNGKCLLHPEALFLAPTDASTVPLERSAGRCICGENNMSATGLPCTHKSQNVRLGVEQINKNNMFHNQSEPDTVLRDYGTTAKAGNNYSINPLPN